MVRSSARFLVCLTLAAFVTAAYLPALDGEFLNWDDDTYVSENRHVHGLSRANVVWAFTTLHTGNWIPFTWLSHALDWQLWGPDPRGHHLTALVLHVANTVLVFLVFEALTGAPWRSAAVAALFGLHPLHVESVAWIAERKDALSTLFWLLAMAAYARYVRVRTPASFLAVAAAFLAGLLSKPMVMTLPFVLLLIDYWPLGRLSWAAVREKVPLLVVAVASAAGALVAQTMAGGVRPTTLVTPADRMANATVSYVRYLGLAAWPYPLSPWYSHPALEGEPLSWWMVTAAAVGLVAVTALVLLLARRRPHLPVGWLWYLGTLVPVIGLVQIGGQAMANRYTYVPLLGIFLLIVWELAALPLWRARWGRRVGAGAAAVILVVLAGLTRQQTRVWHDSMTFWTHTLAVNPRAAVAHYAFGGMLAARGRIDEGIAAYRRALKLRPDYVNAHTEVGNLLVRQGRLAAAAAHYRKAIAARPAAAEDHNNLANVLLHLGQPAAARSHLETALALRPGFAEAHNNLGIVLAEEGRVDDAIAQFRAALRLTPDFPAARSNLAAVLTEREGIRAEATDEQQAVP